MHSKKWFLSALAGVVLILAILFVMIIHRENDSKSGNNANHLIFYTKNNNVYYTSIDKIAPTEVMSPEEQVLDRSFSNNDLFYIQVSENGTKLFYPDHIDLNAPYYSADIFCYDLASKNHDTIKIDSGINNYVPNKNGSKVYYLKDNDLYMSDLSNTKKLAAGVEEFYINQDGDKVIYVTADNHLFTYSERVKAAREIATSAKVNYASKDLNLVYYLKGNDLYRLKDGEGNQLLVSEVASVVNVYDDGSLYYLKADLHTSSEDISGDQSGEVNSLYFYSEGKTTLVSASCVNVWKDKDRPVLVYDQLESGSYVCSGAKVLKKLSDKKPDQLEYDTGNNKIRYAVNNYDDVFSYDLFYVTINGQEISEAKKYAENAQPLNFFSVGDSVIYLKKDGNRTPGDNLFIDGKRIDRNVDLQVHKIKNTNSFVYSSDHLRGTFTLKLYKDGAISKIAEQVSLFQVYDDGRIAYVVGIPSNDSAKLYLYEGSGTSRLIDPKMSGIFPAVENQYYAYHRSTYPVE